ncbi:CSS-motif domain-containing protein [Pseudomonas sp. KNUC1026]|uniref:CSS-motif domain-containing protein n=1 Tax=Pseudomonas sp. KNUC1026 TaxID=2893890 RepID=UPI001F1FEAB0|nr:CSS-motif domain-containing protein [Pseudomonas sp. KNUC1026]UFH51301.1 CSS-motif domain-containing protein [Pseudomonas sp. KNUC1026]
MKPIPQAASPGRTLIIVALAALLPLAAGLVATFHAVEHTLQRETHKVLHKALRQLDQLFNETAAAAMRLHPLDAAHCKQSKPTQPHAVRHHLFVSEFKLVGDCSTRMSEPETEEQDVAWSLMIHPPTAPGDGLGKLHMRYGTEQQHLLMVLNIQSVTRWMKMISDDTYLTLRIGDYQVWDDGALLHGRTTDNQQYASTAKSSSWPYEITSTLSADDVLRAFRDGLLQMLVKLGALSVVCAGLCHWALTRTRG